MTLNLLQREIIRISACGAGLPGNSKDQGTSRMWGGESEVEEHTRGSVPWEKGLQIYKKAQQIKLPTVR